MADEGEIVVEVSATAKGLVPPLEQIVKLHQKNFEVVNIDDQGVLASTFDEDSESPQILSKSSWSVEYRAVDGLGESADFSFGEPVMSAVTSNYQRYEDADLVDVEPQVSWNRKYGSTSWWNLAWAIPLVLLAIAVGVLAWFLRSKPAQTEARRFEVPQEINPFTVLTVLRGIKQRNGIDDKKRKNSVIQSIVLRRFTLGVRSKKLRQRTLSNSLSAGGSRRVEKEGGSHRMRRNTLVFLFLDSQDSSRALTSCPISCPPEPPPR